MAKWIVTFDVNGASSHGVCSRDWTESRGTKASDENVLLPAYRRMIAAYRGAGASFVFLHSDGGVGPLLDMLVDVRIDGLNPLDRKAGMAVEKIRALYPRLVLTGGMCDTDSLINGSAQKVRDEARRIVEPGRDGGIAIGTHSISPEIPVRSSQPWLEAYGSR